MRWEASSYYWDTPTTLAPREASHLLLLRFLVKRNNLKGELIYVYLYTYLIRENHGCISLSPVFVCVCVCFFPLAWVYSCYNWFSGRCVFLFSIFQVCLFVCLYVWSNRMLNSWVHALVGQLVFVGVDETNSKFLSTRTNFALPFDAFFSRDLKQSMSKLSGPVNGDECYFWRTTGCYFADKCRFRHVPESKGVDLKRVEAKYGGKLRVTTPPSQWKKKQK